MNEKFKDVPKEELLDCHTIVTEFLKFIASEVEQKSSEEGK